MGKQIERLNALCEQRNLMNNIYRWKMETFGGQMDNLYKSYNEQCHASRTNALDREIAEAERLADQERAEELATNFFAELSKEGGKAAKSIQTELQKAFSSIKL